MRGLREKELKGVTLKTANLTNNSKIYVLEKTNEINKTQTNMIVEPSYNV